MAVVNIIFHSVSGHTFQMAEALGQGVCDGSLPSLVAQTFLRRPGKHPSEMEAAIARSKVVLLANSREYGANGKRTSRSRGAIKGYRLNGRASPRRIGITMR